MARILNRKRKEQLLIRSMIRLVRQYRRDPVPQWAVPYPFWVCRVVRFLGDERRGILTDCIIQRDFPAGMSIWPPSSKARPIPIKHFLPYPFSRPVKALWSIGNVRKLFSAA